KAKKSAGFMAWPLLNNQHFGTTRKHHQIPSETGVLMLRLVLSFIALIVLGNTSLAQSFDDAENCAAAVQKNDFDFAIDHWPAAIQSGELSDQEAAAAFPNRGLAYYHKKEYDQAIRDYDQATRLNPNDSDYFYRRGLTYFEKHDYDRAIQDLDQTLKLNPDNVAALQKRGWAYENKNDYDQAIRDYDRAISLQSGYSPAFIRRAKVYEAKRQYEQALADYEAATQADPK